MQAAATLADRQNILTHTVHCGKGWSSDSVRIAPLKPSVRAALGTAECGRMEALAAFLPEHERALVLEVLREGRSIAQVARLCGVPASTVRRRVRGMLARMSDPAFAFVAARRMGAAAAAPAPRTGRHDRDDPVAQGARAWPAEWSRSRRVAAEMCVLRGMSARRAAASSGENLRAVLRQVRTLRELAAEWWATARRDGHARGAGGVR